MANIIRNMNFKPIIEKIDYKRLSEPQPSATINMRVWDDLTVQRLRSDAVKVILTRFVKPEPECIFSIEASIGVEVLINTSEYESLEDPVEYFKTSPVGRVLASHMACILSEITVQSQIGPMITAPVVQLPQ